MANALDDVPLLCGHSLCKMQVLELMKYSDKLTRMLIVCPTCQLEVTLDDVLICKLLNELPFKCAVLSSPVPESPCFAIALLRPCKAHTAYNCDACAKGPNGSYMHVRTETGDVATMEWTR